MIRKLDPDRWESVADLARWLLTHADEYEQAVVVLRERRRKAGDPEGTVSTYCCPSMPVIEAVGALELAKYVYIRDSESD